MILVINICKERLHYFEFVNPICDILEKEGIKYFVKNYKEISENDLKKCTMVIICGTSLYDNEFMNNHQYFLWIKDYEKPILGICGGMQVIGFVFGGKLGKKIEIGYYSESFKKDFLGMSGKQEVYHLHNNYSTFGEDFEEYTLSKIPQAVRHKEKETYGVLFHPEVRNKEMIARFARG